LAGDHRVGGPLRRLEETDGFAGGVRDQPEMAGEGVLLAGGVGIEFAVALALALGIEPEDPDPSCRVVDEGEAGLFAGAAAGAGTSYQGESRR